MSSLFQRLCCFTFVLACILAPQVAHAQDRTLRMAYEEFDPYSFTDENGQARGLSVDLFRHIAEAAGYSADFVKAENPGDALDMLNAGAAELTSLLALTPARLDRGLATDPLGAFESRAFALRRSGRRTVEDLAGARVGVVRGSYALATAGAIPFVQLVEFAQTDDMVVPLLSGEIDAVVSAGDSFRARLRAMEVSDAVHSVTPALAVSPYGFVIAPERADVQAAFNAAIAADLSQAQLATLRRLWFGSDRRLTETPLFWAILGGRSAS
ncbi:transporter substrate-binding domain-containing protein [Sulfitobacter albidus]|uniref:Transporter substrate-binding domain-containing protein n=1 Tax=Sulfitobacter albidus TaxID=2829501 RepID=A0A975JF67_9RHOB|nr:transporter substrate-binding domain-containing protein [Sulfitobacter albidus]QUJ77333.1 transporter substrate-binding domain-containing protein [Sulfitobacter albidus]